MRRLALVLWLSMALVLETTFFNDLQFMGVEPDLVLILTTAFALLNGPGKGAIFGFIGGLAQDILIGRYIGMNALTKALTCYLIGQVEQKVYKEHFLVPVAFVCIGTFFNEILFYFIGRFLGLDMSLSDAFSEVILPMVIYNGLVAPLIYQRFYRSSTKGWLKTEEFRDW